MLVIILLTRVFVIELTFIVLARQKDRIGITDKDIKNVLETSSMAGDVNLFVSERHIDTEGEAPLDAELEVMIAGECKRKEGICRIRH